MWYTKWKQEKNNQQKKANINERFMLHSRVNLLSVFVPLWADHVQWASPVGCLQVFHFLPQVTVFWRVVLHPGATKTTTCCFIQAQKKIQRNRVLHRFIRPSVVYVRPANKISRDAPVSQEDDVPFLFTWNGDLEMNFKSPFSQRGMDGDMISLILSQKERFDDPAVCFKCISF